MFPFPWLHSTSQPSHGASIPLLTAKCELPLKGRVELDFRDDSLSKQELSGSQSKGYLHHLFLYCPYFLLQPE